VRGPGRLRVQYKSVKGRYHTNGYILYHHLVVKPADRKSKRVRTHAQFSPLRSGVFKLAMRPAGVSKASKRAQRKAKHEAGIAERRAAAEAAAAAVAAEAAAAAEVASTEAEETEEAETMRDLVDANIEDILAAISTLPPPPLARPASLPQRTSFLSPARVCASSTVGGLTEARAFARDPGCRAATSTSSSRWLAA